MNHATPWQGRRAPRDTVNQAAATLLAVLDGPEKPLLVTRMATAVGTTA